MDKSGCSASRIRVNKILTIKQFQTWGVHRRATKRVQCWNCPYLKTNIVTSKWPFHRCIFVLEINAENCHYLKKYYIIVSICLREYFLILYRFESCTHVTLKSVLHLLHTCRLNFLGFFFHNCFIVTPFEIQHDTWTPTYLSFPTLISIHVE